MTYKVLVPFTLQREYNKGEILTEGVLLGFTSLYLSNGSIAEVEDKRPEPEQEAPQPQIKPEEVQKPTKTK